MNGNGNGNLNKELFALVNRLSSFQFQIYKIFIYNYVCSVKGKYLPRKFKKKSQIIWNFPKFSMGIIEILKEISTKHL